MNAETTQQLTRLEKAGFAGLLLWPLVVVVILLGNITGDFQGYYAQTELAIQFQTVAIVLMVVTMLILTGSGWSETQRKED